MIVCNKKSALKARQIVNALIQLKKNSSNISTILDDLNEAYDIEELEVMQSNINLFIKDYDQKIAPAR